MVPVRIVQGYRGCARAPIYHDQTEIPFRLHRFAEVSIGAATFRNAPIEVADLSVSDVGMLLGVDYFSTRHVWLSYATEQMFVERPAGAVPTASR